MKAEKNNKKWIIYSIIVTVVLVLLITGLYFGTKINALLKGDITISLDPQDTTILAIEGETKTVTFNVTTENMAFCEAKCKYTFRSLANSTEIDSGDFIGTNTNFLKTYDLVAPQRGVGQLAYEFLVECQNQQSFLCHTASENRVKSSFVTINYELSSSEKEFIANVSTKLVNFLRSLSALDVKAQETSAKVKMLSEYMNILELESDNQVFWNQVTDLITQSDLLKDKWAKEDYSYLDANLSNQISAVENLNSDLKKIENAFLDKSKLYQEESKEILDFKKHLSKLNKINFAYFLIANQTISNQTNFATTPVTNPTQSFQNNILDEYQAVVQKFNQKQYDDYLLVKSDLAFIDKQIEVEHARLENKLIGIAVNGILLCANYTNINQSLPTPKNISSAFVSLNLSCTILKNQINKVENSIKLENASENQSSLPTISNESLAFVKKYCDLVLSANPNKFDYDFSDLNVSIKALPENISVSAVSRVSEEIVAHKTVCCLFSVCNECCNDASCQNDPKMYPLILIHGHSFSKDTTVELSLAGFEKIRNKLKEEGYIDVGTALPTEEFTEYEEGVFGKFGKPVVVGTTYYVDSYDALGNFVSIPSKSENISTYAARLNKTIELVKFKTGAKKVNVFAYSMGGLVARKYLVDFGEESVNKLITLGTPNKGVVGKVESFCPVTGNLLECKDMSSTSKFINELNAPDNEPKLVKVYAIFGSGCQMDGGKSGDGVVLAKNSELSHALNFEISGSCTSTKTMHEELRDIDKYPRVYETIRNVLKN